MNRTEYIGKLNALYVGDKNCLEELITTYDEKGKEIERLNNIINSLENWLEERLEKLDINGFDDDIFNGLEFALNKLRELKGSE